MLRIISIIGVSLYILAIIAWLIVIFLEEVFDMYIDEKVGYFIKGVYSLGVVIMFFVTIIIIISCLTSWEIVL